MKRNTEYPAWFLWIWEKGFVLFLGFGLLFLAIMIGCAWFIEHRLDQVEARLQFQPPRSYEAPDLSAYPIGNVDIDQLPVRKRVYVPIYSHVYFRGGAPYPLETTLSVRNISTSESVYLSEVNYFDTSGKLVRAYLDDPIGLGPLQTVEFLVEVRDSSGGSGANFVIEWRGSSDVSKPLVEAVMVGAFGNQGISFSRIGIEMAESQVD